VTIQHRAVCDVCGKEEAAVAVSEVSAYGITGGAPPPPGYRFDHPGAWVTVAWSEGAIRREGWVCSWPCVEQLAQAKDER
jgi:hypothetical protein